MYHRMVPAVFLGHYGLIEGHVVYSNRPIQSENSLLWPGPPPSSFVPLKVEQFKHFSVRPPEPQWIHPQHPYLTLIPTGSFRAALKHRIFRYILYDAHRNTTEADCPIRYSKSRACWIVQEKIYDRWNLLDRLLYEFITRANAIIPIPQAEIPPLPHTFFGQPHQSEKQMRQTFEGTQRLFLPIIARITYTLLFLRRSDSWREKMYEDGRGFTQSFFDDLDQSIIGDFKTPRLGGILHADFISDELVDALSTFNMPLYVVWKPGPRGDSKYYPTEEILASLRELTKANQSLPQPLPQPVINVDYVMSEEAADAPAFKALPWSKQRNGETWQEFFQRREQRIEKSFQTVKDSKILQSWTARRDNAKKGMCPSTKGSARGLSVFLWEKQDGGYRLRTRKDKVEWQDLWSEYKHRKRYNPIDNEWDICSEFCEEDCVPYPYADSDDDSDGIPAPSEPEPIRCMDNTQQEILQFVDPLYVPPPAKDGSIFSSVPHSSSIAPYSSPSPPPAAAAAVPSRSLVPVPGALAVPVASVAATVLPLSSPEIVPTSSSIAPVSRPVPSPAAAIPSLSPIPPPAALPVTSVTPVAPAVAPTVTLVAPTVTAVAPTCTSIISSFNPEPVLTSNSIAPFSSPVPSRAAVPVVSSLSLVPDDLAAPVASLTSVIPLSGPEPELTRSLTAPVTTSPAAAVPVVPSFSPVPPPAAPVTFVMPSSSPESVISVFYAPVPSDRGQTSAAPSSFLPPPSPSPPPPTAPDVEALDLSALSEALIAHSYEEGELVRQVSFVDHFICPSDAFKDRYGLRFPAAPTPKRAKVDSNIAPLLPVRPILPLLATTFIGYNHFDRDSWGTVAEWELIATKVDAMCTPSTPGTSLEAPSLTGTDTNSASLRVKIASRVHRGIGIADSPCYVLPFPASESAIILTSAVDVFEVFRRGWDLLDMVSLAEKLCERAISFLPAVEGEDTVSVQPLETGNGLGWRPQDYKPTAGDVLVYKSLVVDFLLSPRGRLALFHGGIVTRIALNHIDLDAASLLPDFSECPYSVKAGKKTYLFDMLSVDEVEKICGVYYVNTGVYFHYLCHRSHVAEIALQAAPIKRVDSRGGLSLIC
jgi:hypothetical protein